MTQRTYSLGNSYRFTASATTDHLYTATSGGTSIKRLLLHSIAVAGKSGGILHTYAFTYQKQMDNNPNQIHLVTADNGWGGKTTYALVGHRVHCPSAICGADGVRDTRFAVTQTWVEDGLGNTIYTTYFYSNTNASSGAWGHIGLEDGSAQFFGFERSQATYYALNSSTSVIKWDDQTSWPPAQSEGNADPRTGKPKRLEVRVSNGGAIVAATNYNWQSYRRVNGLWQSAAGNQLIVNGNVTYPIIWVRQEAVDTWTAAGSWSGSSYSINGNGSGKLTKTTYDNTATVRGYGNVTSVAESSHDATSIALATWNSNVAGNSGLTLLRTTVTEFFPNTTAWIVNKPARVRILDGGGACKSDTRTVYDNGASGYYNIAPTQGLPRRFQQALTSCGDAIPGIGDVDNGWKVTYMEYDGYGNQTRSTEWGNSSSQDVTLYTSYDNTYHLFPVSQNLNGSTTYKETATYYGVNEITGHSGVSVWGAMQEHCGVNELCTRQTYDQFGRPALRWEAVVKSSSWGLADSNALVQWGYNAFGGAQTVTTVTEWRNPRPEGNFVRKLYNGLGQLVQEQTPYQNWSAASGAQEIIVDYLYNALGNQTRVSTPWLTAKYSSGDIRRTPNWGSYSRTDYDAGGAVSQSVAPNGEQQQSNYSGRSFAVVGLGRNGDPNKVLKWQESNGLGYPKYVRTYTKPYGEGGTVDGTVTFTHNVLGNLTDVAHPNSIAATTLTYDLGGRKTGMTDPDLGTWSYDYDRQSKLTRQTDARGNTTCLYYDTIGRLVGKQFRTDTACPAAPAYNVVYNYDENHSSTNRSRGQITSIWNSGVNPKRLYYNSQGLLAQEEVSIVGAPQIYTTLYGYDSYLRPNTTTYPDGEVVTVNYNGMGLPSALYSSWWGSNPIIDSVSYDNAGRLRQLRLPQSTPATTDDLWRSYIYFPWIGTDGNSNGRLHYMGVGTSADSFDRLLFDYRYDSFGNVSLHNPNQGVWNNFSYDAQNRLTNGYGLPYTYDSAGRMTNYENIGATAFRGHAVRDRYNSQWYYYDANGNMISRWTAGGWQSLTWDHENHLVNITGTTLPTESYLYDADGQRVRKTSNGVTTYYINQFYEVSGSTITKYHYFNGQRVSMHTNAGGSWAHYDLHSDHLGSTVLVTTQGGGTHSGEGYYAYGRPRMGGIPLTDHKFTGQKRDGTGLLYYGARYYDPELGQFISPDTLVPDPSNLFDYNRYMYVRGNPMNMNDPSGHQSCMAMGAFPPAALGCQIGELAARYGPTVMQLAVQWADKLPAVDWLFSSAEQGTHSAGQQNAGNSSTGDPFDPNDPWKSFRNRGMEEQGVKAVQKATQNGVDPAKMFQQYNDLLNKGVDMTGHALEQAQAEKISTQRIADTFTGAARNTQYFWESGRVAQWSPHTNVAVIVEKTSRQVVTVFERTAPQRQWLPMTAFEVIKWLEH